MEVSRRILLRTLPLGRVSRCEGDCDFWEFGSFYYEHGFPFQFQKGSGLKGFGSKGFGFKGFQWGSTKSWILCILFFSWSLPHYRPVILLQAVL